MAIDIDREVLAFFAVLMGLIMIFGIGIDLLRSVDRNLRDSE